jgi:hypothetical protein
VGNINMDLREMVLDGVDWIEMAHKMYQLRAPCEHGVEPSGSMKC